MRAIRRPILFVLATISFALTALPLFAQQVIATVSVGVQPNAVAVNQVTNKTYITNGCGNDIKCDILSPGTVTVIDGATNTTTTVNVEYDPLAVAVNPVTNKIYVVNDCGNDPYCSSPGTVTVIDGATNNTATVTMGAYPLTLAVNSVTNKIYVVNCGADCQSGSGTVTVIDGATNNTATINVGYFPNAIAVNSVTNQIYVVNEFSRAVTVIDGATNSVVTTVAVGNFPFGLAVNPVTNKVYVSNQADGTVTVIDGYYATSVIDLGGGGPAAIAVNPVTNKIYVACFQGVVVINGGTGSTATITTGSQEPSAVAVDPVTNKIYVTNSSDNTGTMIDGATNQTTTVSAGKYPTTLALNSLTNRIYVVNTTDDTASVIAGGTSTALQFVSMTPCRLVDTRKSGGPIQGGTSQSFILPQLGGCNIPATAAAYSLNVTVVPPGPLGYLTIWPTGEDQPLVSTMNSLDGRIKANAAVVPAGYQGAESVFVSNTTDVVLDIDGYFAPTSGSTLAFYPLAPCRVADTRKSTFPQGLGSPHLSGGVARDFPVLNASSCNIPSSAQAYSLNFTAVPYPAMGNPLGYLELWPTGQKPANPVSTLNNLTGTIVANAAIVPAGTGGDITAYASNDTDLVIDINGYFAPAGQGGLSLYPAAPCRVIDTRKGNGAFSGLLSPPVDVVDSVCAPPAAAQAYVFNATVVPTGGLGYLTLWPDGESQPVVSTLNAIDGAITSNMAIVPTNNGKVDAYASGITQLILDISSYFAP